MAATKPLKIKTEPWPNRLGVNVIVNRIRFEIWNDGRFVRVVKDNSLCGYRGTHYLDCRDSHDPLPERDEDKAALAYERWMQFRPLWKECEN